MILVEKKSHLEEEIALLSYKKGKLVGFVPTMGFLHKGHVELVHRCVSENNISICSIFVNPHQFNDKTDYALYPRDIPKDIKILKDTGCDIVYIPDPEEIYPDNYQKPMFNFGRMEQVMEGFFRPGHFQGVAEVVRILFEHVKPQQTYFGEKDFQQYTVIKQLVRQFFPGVSVIPCPIVREENGLAMSSRNSRLSFEGRQKASFIYQQLLFCKESYGQFETPESLKNIVQEHFSENIGFQLEYIEIADRTNLTTLTQWGDSQDAGAFIACYLEGVRLIDNIKLF